MNSPGVAIFCMTLVVFLIGANWWIGYRRVDPAVRRRRRAFRRFVYPRRTISMGAVFLAFGMIGVVAGLRPLLIYAVMNYLGLGMLAVGGTLLWGRKLHFETRLRRNQWRVCPHCFYDLEGIAAEGRCPECGAPYTPETLEIAWRLLL